ncbi:hypothetical protein MMC13_005613 [Lambiella insularis]|nr:hypothetical protein [Lambiella insularis]
MSPSPFRNPTRFVTTQNADGLSVFESAKPTAWQVHPPHQAKNLMYMTSTPVPSFTDNQDLKAHNAIDVDTHPLITPNGSNIRVVDTAPLGLSRNPATGEEAQPFMHRTHSLDYAICVQGEMECILDSGQRKTMKQGGRAGAAGHQACMAQHE